MNHGAMLLWLLWLSAVNCKLEANGGQQEQHIPTTRKSAPTGAAFDICISPRDPAPLNIANPVLLQRVVFTRLSGGLRCGMGSLSAFGCGSHLPTELPDRPRLPVLGLLLCDKHNRTILPSNAVDGYWSYGTSTEWYSVQSYQDGEELQWNLIQPISVSGVLWLRFAMPVSPASDSQTVCLRMQLNPPIVSRAAGLLVHTVLPKWLPVGASNPSLDCTCRNSGVECTCDERVMDREQYMQALHTSGAGLKALCYKTPDYYKTLTTTLYTNPLKPVESAPAEPYIDSFVMGPSVGWLGRSEQGSWLSHPGNLGDGEIYSPPVSNLARIDVKWESRGGAGLLQNTLELC